MTGIGTQIKNALGWFLTKLKGNVVNNLTSTSTDLPLSAAKGKDLQDQITSLNTNLPNDMIYIERTSEAWLSKAYTSVDVCSYKILKSGLYVAIGYVTIGSTKTDRSYYCSLKINGVEVSKMTQQGNLAYAIQCPVSTILNCKVNDIITTTAQVNYVNENYAGLATGVLRLIRIPSK